jgi:hypothetical protein
MPEYKLGDQVEITNFLVRSDYVSYKILERMYELWPEMPEGMKWKVREYQENRKLSAHHVVWVPATLQREMDWDHWFGLNTRQHPSPSIDSVGLPVTGIVVQRCQRQDGLAYSGSYEDPGGFIQHSSTTGYKVAYSLNRRPLLVAPYMMRKVES